MKRRRKKTKRTKPKVIYIIAIPYRHIYTKSVSLHLNRTAIELRKRWTVARERSFAHTTRMMLLWNLNSSWIVVSKSINYLRFICVSLYVACWWCCFHCCCCNCCYFVAMFVVCFFPRCIPYLYVFSTNFVIYLYYTYKYRFVSCFVHLRCCCAPCNINRIKFRMWKDWNIHKKKCSILSTQKTQRHWCRTMAYSDKRSDRWNEGEEMSYFFVFKLMV